MNKIFRFYHITTSYRTFKQPFGTVISKMFGHITSPYVVVALPALRNPLLTKILFVVLKQSELNLRAAIKAAVYQSVLAPQVQVRLQIVEWHSCSASRPRIKTAHDPLSTLFPMFRQNSSLIYVMTVRAFCRAMQTLTGTMDGSFAE
jgi:hypothetical protein